MQSTLNIVATIAGLVAFFAPELSTKWRIVFGLVMLIIFLWNFWLKNYALHSFFFKKDKLQIYCEQVSPVLRDGNVFHYRYYLVVVNRYSENKTIKNLNIRFSAPMTMMSYDILLCDLNKELLRIDIKDYSILSVKVESFNGLQVFGIIINCKSDFKEKYPFLDPKGLVYFNENATLISDYKLFNKKHSGTIHINPTRNVEIFDKKDLIFDIDTIVDQRNLPDDYPYIQASKFVSEDESKSIRIHGLRDKHLLIEYYNSEKIIRYKSSKPLDFYFYPIRVVVLRNGWVGIISSLAPFERQEL